MLSKISRTEFKDWRDFVSGVKKPALSYASRVFIFMITPCVRCTTSVIYTGDEMCRQKSRGTRRKAFEDTYWYWGILFAQFNLPYRKDPETICRKKVQYGRNTWRRCYPNQRGRSYAHKLGSGRQSICQSM